MSRLVDPDPWREPPRLRRSRLPLVLVLLLVAAGGVVAIAGCLFLAFGLGIERGYFPEAEAVPGKRLSQPTLEFLRTSGLLRPDEEVVYLYSSGLLSFRSGGCFFTERRVVDYWERSGSDQIESEVAEYSEIEAIEPRFDDGFWADSRVTIRTVDGRRIDLVVSNTSGGDRIFAERLEAQWRKAEEASRPQRR